MTDNVKPLAGIKVADFSMVYAGPICTRLLADCGAEVIKIEPLGTGDNVRGTPRVFAHFNAGKRSLQLDLTSTAGREVAAALIDTADVVIENYRPGVMQRFGLDHATVRAQRPEVVYCSISGFGQTGPDAQRAAYAPIAHAASGYDIAHLRAQFAPEPVPADAQPAASGIMIADMLTGAYAFGAIQTALLGRAQSGLGDHIDTSMLESMMMLIPGQMQIAQRTDPARPGGGFLPVRTGNGSVMICIVSDKNFAGLCRALERPELQDDPRFQRGVRIKNIRELVSEIEQWSTALTVEQCERALNDCGVPCSHYNAAEDLFDDPQLAHREAFTTFTDEYGDYLVQNAPFRFARAANGTTPQVPAPGEHTQAVLTELGYSAERISALRTTGVIA